MRTRLPKITRSVTINGHEKQPLWLHNLKKLVQVGEDFDNHFLFGELCAWIVAMRAVVYDTIHIQVEVVN